MVIVVVGSRCQVRKSVSCGVRVSGSGSIASRGGGAIWMESSLAIEPCPATNAESPPTDAPKNARRLRKFMAVSRGYMIRDSLEDMLRESSRNSERRTELLHGLRQNHTLPKQRDPPLKRVSRGRALCSRSPAANVDSI